MSKDYLTKSDWDLLAWGKNFYRRLTAAAARLGVPADVTNEVNTLCLDYETKLTTASEPATRTKTAIKLKDVAREKFKKRVRQVVKEYVMNNHLTTDGDRDDMGLPIHDEKPTPVNPPTDVPDGTADTSTHQRHALNVKSSATPRRAKPDGVHGFEVWSKVGGAPPARDEEWTYVNTATRSPMIIDYPQVDVGKTVYYRFRWVNEREQPGPWSEGILEAVIA